MNTDHRIEKFNETNRPFYIVSHDDGMFSLCLPIDFLKGEHEDYCQNAFDMYAAHVGDQLCTVSGFRTHGSGYEWEAAFHQAFLDDTDIKKIMFDCEAGGFYCNSGDLNVLERFGQQFKAICEDTERFVPIIAAGIERQEAWEAERERLMRTVGGGLMWKPTAAFDIATPDGVVHLTPEDNRQLLDGTMQTIQVGVVEYSANELLELKIKDIQRDLLDRNLIKMKVEVPEMPHAHTMSI